MQKIFSTKYLIRGYTNDQESSYLQISVDHESYMSHDDDDHWSNDNTMIMQTNLSNTYFARLVSGQKVLIDGEQVIATLHDEKQHYFMAGSKHQEPGYTTDFQGSLLVLDTPHHPTENTDDTFLTVFGNTSTRYNEESLVFVANQTLRKQESVQLVLGQYPLSEMYRMTQNQSKA